MTDQPRTPDGRFTAASENVRAHDSLLYALTSRPTKHAALVSRMYPQTVAPAPTNQ